MTAELEAALRQAQRIRTVSFMVMALAFAIAVACAVNMFVRFLPGWSAMLLTLSALGCLFGARRLYDAAIQNRSCVMAAVRARASMKALQMQAAYEAAEPLRKAMFEPVNTVAPPPADIGEPEHVWRMGGRRTLLELKRAAYFTIPIQVGDRTVYPHEVEAFLQHYVGDRDDLIPWFADNTSEGPNGQT